MYCNKEENASCPFSQNGNCTKLDQFGECDDGIGALVKEMEEINRRIHESTRPQEVAMLVTEAEMLERTISDFISGRKYRQRFDDVRNEIFG